MEKRNERRISSLGTMVYASSIDEHSDLLDIPGLLVNESPSGLCMLTAVTLDEGRVIHMNEYPGRYRHFRAEVRWMVRLTDSLYKVGFESVN